MTQTQQHCTLINNYQLFVVVKIYQSILVPTLTYGHELWVPTLTSGHELWVVTQRTRWRVQAAEMSFLRRVAGLSLRDRVRSSVIQGELGVDPLLLRDERSQMNICVKIIFKFKN